MPTVSPPTTDASIEARVFWLRFQKEIAAGLILILLVIVAFAGYRLYADRRDSAAAAALAGAKTPQEYQKVITQYPSSPAAASAYLLLADAQRKEGKFSDANTTLQLFINSYPKHELVPSAYVAMAANLESLGKTDEALAMYQRAAANYPDSYAGPLALISQVTLLKSLKRTDEARRVCEAILTRYRMPGDQQQPGAPDNRPQSMWAVEAMRQMRLLKPAEQPKPATTQGVPPMLAAPSPGQTPALSVTPSAQTQKPK